ncbi:hypothetical protein [Salinivibrio costicola]|uniref:hypothetical protein n=1 Tax=Salinivibrio costicola TaxID=51367 RepID=UPI001FCB2F35|nr:hypothetical protein [Salinivibrio costicola]
MNNHEKFKLSRAVSFFLCIALFSVSLNASESKFDIDAPLNNSVTTAISELAETHASLGEQDKKIKLLTEKQQSNERQQTLEAKIESLEMKLEAITSEKGQSKEETRLERRLESIESSLSSMTNKNKYFTYADWAAVAITCVAVLLTIIGLAIAALAFWGYREIKELTKNSAAKEAKSVAQKTMEEMIHEVAKSELEKLINDGKLLEPLQDAVDMILRSDPNNVEKRRSEELLHELDIFDSEFDGYEDGDASVVSKNRR